MVLGPICPILLIVSGLITAITTVVFGTLTTVAPLPGGIETLLAEHGNLVLGGILGGLSLAGGKLIHGLIVAAIFSIPFVSGAAC